MPENQEIEKLERHDCDIEGPHGWHTWKRVNSPIWTCGYLGS